MNEIEDGDSADEDWSTAWDENSSHEKESAKQLITSKQDQLKVGTERGENKPGGSVSEASLLSRMQLNDNKAGMEGLDKQKINQIIYEASKGSRYYENELKREEQVNRRITEQKSKLDKLTEQNIKQGEIVADGLLQEFESTRTLDRAIVHIDMDAFYAAVEIRDQPSLKDKPMAVGGNSMLSTSNYVARKYGVRAAMPGFIGKKLCPQLVIVPTNFDKYTAVSTQVRTIMADYDPNFCPMSLDEAYLDFTEHLKVRVNMNEEERSFAAVQDREDCACRYSLHKTAAAHDHQTDEGICSNCGLFVSDEEKLVFGCDVDEAVREMRHRIHLRTRLTASAGIAPNTMLAKVCSDKNKPNGQFRINPDREEVMNFIQDLPIRKVSGVGKVSERMLSSIGVVTCSDLYKYRGLIYHLYSNISYNYFMRISLGLGSTEVCRDGERKSLSTETTFREINKPEELYAKCAELCKDVVEDLKKEQLLGKTVGIKIKTVKFELKTRAQTVTDYTQSYEQIYKTAKDLLKIEINACHPQPLRLRLMGVRMSNLINESEMSKQRQNTITSFLKKKSDNFPLKSSNMDSNDKIIEGSLTKGEQSNKEERNVIEGNPETTTQRRVFKSMIQTMYQRSAMKKLEASSDHDTELNTGVSNIAYEGVDKPVGVDNKTSVDAVSGHIYNLKVANNNTTQTLQKADDNRNDLLTVKSIGKCDLCNKSNNSCNCCTVSNSSDESTGTAERTTSTLDISTASKSAIQASTSATPVSVTILLASPSLTTTSISTAASSTIATPNSTKKKSLESLQCPVCSRTIKSSSVKVITEHIDYCLLKNEKQNEIKVLESKGIPCVVEKLEATDETLELKCNDSNNYETDNFGDVNKSDDSNAEVDADLNLQVTFSKDIKLQKELTCDKVDMEGSEAESLDHKSKTDEKEKTNIVSYEVETGVDSKMPLLQRNAEENIKIEVDNNTLTCKVNRELEIPQEKSNALTSENLNCNKKLGRNLSEEATIVPSEASTSGVGFDSFPYICPVCNVSQYEMNLSDFNVHVDSCLSKKAIKEILHESDSNTFSSGAMINNNKRTAMINNKRTASSIIKGKLPKNKKQKMEKGLQTLEGFVRTDK